MSSVVKDNSNNKIKKFIEDFKNFSSILVGKASTESNDLSLEDYTEENFDIVEELKNSSLKIDKTAKLYEASVGVPSKAKKEKKISASKSSESSTSKINSESSKTYINPIISINNDKNISMFRNDDFLR